MLIETPTDSRIKQEKPAKTPCPAASSRPVTSKFGERFGSLSRRKKIASRIPRSPDERSEIRESRYSPFGLTTPTSVGPGNHGDAFYGEERAAPFPSRLHLQPVARSPGVLSLLCSGQKRPLKKTASDSW
jgi:hypothetical protein